MSATMAAPPPRLDSVLSFSDALPNADHHHPSTTEDPDTTTTATFSDVGSDADDESFEFAFAPPLAGPDHGAATTPADDLFAHGRLLPAYPLFDRHLLHLSDDELTSSSSSSTAPSADTYCAWAPRSAPGSPAREFPKSASTGDARRSWRLRDLVTAGGRSHSDGKEKFVFLHSTPPPSPPSKTPAAASDKTSTPAQQQKQSKTKKNGKAAATEMDLATAHRRFYGKQGGGGGALAGERKQQHQSYLPYRQGIVGFFAAAHALGGRSHHPY
ncbi:hypothetical protein HU200_046567 [Digitaria exilis]|uniref:Uncharacterized protein n=1 Tax=Digitaria exilis TaxID=1010633 RepID=A0A835AVJ7_9POAL|nr:hypothetical protein HU200_046567 [Digitaria exilis]CAB3445502.1 unnamed protein product [Digitaria exilis]